MAASLGPSSFFHYGTEAAAMPFSVGDKATIVPRFGAVLPYILEFERQVRVARVDDAGQYWVTTGTTEPPDLELGPLPAETLSPGWRSQPGAAA